MGDAIYFGNEYTTEQEIAAFANIDVRVSSRLTATIGGRYSVLSPFGLVPGAAMGIDVARFLNAAQLMVRSCGPDVPPRVNPGVQLGTIFGAGISRGRAAAVGSGWQRG